jgi:hypothetical protein
MLVKGSNNLYALRTMVYLVKVCPKKINAMTPSMPPVKNKSGNKVGYYAA